MNPTLQEIELSLFDKLKCLNCVPIKNIIAIEPNVNLKSILLDQSYAQEKLNIFIWVIFKVEPKFAPEFIDSEYFAPDIKCKKIIDCLTNLGIVDPFDFTKDKLFNTTTKFYKEVLLVLDDVSKLLPQRSNQIANLDDFSFDMSINTSFMPNFQNPKNENFDEIFSKKIQIFDDPSYLSEYKSIVQPGSSSSLIPSDLIRVIKNINANSTYLDNIQLGKSFKSELVQNLESHLNDLKQEIDMNRNNLQATNTINFNLIQLNENNDEFMEYNIKLEKYLEEIQSYISGFKEMTREFLNDDKLMPHQSSIADINEFKSETNLGENFEKFYLMIENYQKIKLFFKNWSLFINKQDEKKNEYEMNSFLIKNDHINKFLGENEIFIKQIEESLNCLGNNRIFS
ncbi:unnamed protein product [Brachionus calyciflorus]|uniref:Uncharacterized protein n=1 Tax=Brachionus calyciflorus TaxID=104777 RepID=A0A813VDM8_9BILA|nr:unnamed protein product [Brachionus calyciflorus]